MKRSRALFQVSALAVLVFITAGAGETFAQRGATLPPSGTYSVTFRTDASTCQEHDATGSEVAFTATVNTSGAGLRMTIPESANWRLWAGALNSGLLTLTAMQEGSAVERLPGHTWQGVSYLQLSNSGADTWAGSGMRVFKKSATLCQSHVSVQMRRL